MKHFLGRDPYTYFFTAGLISALVGVSLWLGFYGGLVSFYPRQAHGNLMFFGFLWSFVAGFLMTAVPRMTAAQPAGAIEIILGLGFVAVQWVLNFANAIEPSVMLYAAQMALLVLFIARRFSEKRRVPFEGFIFLPFAFAMCGLGLAICFYDCAKIQLVYLFSGQAFLLNLICGLGSRLIPVLSRVPEAVAPDIGIGLNKRRLKIYFILALLLNGSFLLEGLGDLEIGYALRAVILMWMAISLFRVFERPAARSYVGIGLKVAVLSLVISCLAPLLPLGLNLLALQHLQFILGLALVTLMVATRVTVAHGAGHMTWELQPWPSLAVTGLFVISAGARVAMGADIRSSLLVVAAAMFLLGIIAWSLRLFKTLWCC